MPDNVSRPSDTSIPGESPDPSLPIPGSNNLSNDHRRSTSEYLQPPRLGIIHLLVLMTVTAILMQAQTSIMAQLNQQIPFKSWVPVIIIMIVYAADVTGAGILLNIKCHRVKGRFQPGHWILFYSVVASLAAIILGSIVSIVVNGTRQNAPGLIDTAIIVHFTRMIAEVIAFLWFASELPEKGRWKILFQLWALITLFQLFVYSLSIMKLSTIPEFFYGTGSYVLFQKLPAILLLLVAILDLVRGARRDWLHWLGVCNMIFISLITFLFYWFAH
jgi:hypothetical protein